MQENKRWIMTKTRSLKEQRFGVNVIIRITNTLMNAQDTRQLNYDLQILHDHVQAHCINRVVVAFVDSEAFEAKLLADLIDILR